MAGPEFGSEQGNGMLVVRELYGMKSFGESLRGLLAKKFHELCYMPSISDPDVYTRPSVKPGGFIYYEYVICYVGDIIFIAEVCYPSEI